jgi:hypothetical protein
MKTQYRRSYYSHTIKDDVGKVRYSTKEVSVMLGISVPLVYHFWKQIRGEKPKGQRGRLTVKQVEEVRRLAAKEEATV